MNTVAQRTRPTVRFLVIVAILLASCANAFAGASHAVSRPAAPRIQPNSVTGQVTLSWGAAVGADTYTVYRSTTSGGPYTSIVTGLTATSFVDSSLAVGTYYYAVTGVNIAGEGPKSNEASATIGVPQVSGLTATPGNSQVALSWTGVTGADSYTVKRGTSSGGPYSVVASGLAAGATSYTDTGLSNGVAYYYVVDAYSGATPSIDSAQASATPVNAPPTIATGASANPATVTSGTTTALSILGADDLGESNLTYTWSATGPATVSFSPNASNAAKSATATFTLSGAYAITCTVTDSQGASTTSSVAVQVNQCLTTIAITPASATLATGATKTFTAKGKDQFAVLMAAQPTWTWRVLAGGAGGTIGTGGKYTAPSVTGTDTIKASASNGQGSTISKTATVTITASSGSGGSLGGSVATPGPTSVNLTNEGTLDWAHWGRGVPGMDHDATGGGQISNYTALNAVTASSYGTDPRSDTWTNGTPLSSVTNYHFGVHCSAATVGNGFSVTAPADQTVRTLIVYVGGGSSAGTFTAHLSDGSAADYTDTMTTPGATSYDRAYTIVYSAGSSGQKITLTWAAASASATGTVALQAVTLH